MGGVGRGGGEGRRAFVTEVVGGEVQLADPGLPDQRGQRRGGVGAEAVAAEEKPFQGLFALQQGVEQELYAVGADPGVDQVEGAQRGVAAQQGGQGAGAVREERVALEPEGADGRVLAEGGGEEATPSGPIRLQPR